MVKKINSKNNLAKPKPTPTKSKPKPSTRIGAASGYGKAPKGVSQAISEVRKRADVTAREARDIVTAVANVFGPGGQKRTDINRGGKGPTVVKNLGRQIKETAVAAATGKKGTRSDITKLYPSQVKGSNRNVVEYTKGTQRGKRK
jgi:hypothetical protein